MGFVKYMEVERQNGNDDLCIDHPSLEQILSAICSLDGKVSTYVMLFPNDEDPTEAYLSIGGGNDGRFLVNHWDGVNEVERRVIDPSVTSDEYVDVMMVQLTERKAPEIVDQATALKVATAYDVTGELTTEVSWKTA
jgi:hypothetical protein